jgi:hypothetical protein
VLTAITDVNEAFANIPQPPTLTITPFAKITRKQRPTQTAETLFEKTNVPKNSILK